MGSGVASMDCLPDEILVQILPLLPTKQAVSTSVLSKRWRNLFAFCPNLDVEYEFILWYLDVDDSILKKKNIQMCFEEFVDSRLAFQSSNHIKSFSLKYIEHRLGLSKGVVAVKRWICSALEHGITELYLTILSSYRFDFPSEVFTSKTLVKLSLGKRLKIDSFPLDLYLPSLKFLVLDTIWFEGDQLSDVFLPACPALEDLTIFHRLRGRLKISSKTIKKLSVTIEYDSSTISLDIRSVVDLYYSDNSGCRFSYYNSDSLVKATLDLSFFKENDVMDLISGIRNVKTLHLTSSAVEVITVCCKGGLPVFNNLVDLMFSSRKQGWTKLLPFLLERSPNLKTLVLSGLNCYTFNRKHRFVGTRVPPNNQIKMLRIMEYGGSENEMKHISHFFLNMKFLQVVKVYVAPSMDNPTKTQLTEDLLKLPAASSELEIQVM